jgi:hypothetical protein
VGGGPAYTKQCLILAQAMDDLQISSWEVYLEGPITPRLVHDGVVGVKRQPALPISFSILQD